MPTGKRTGGCNCGRVRFEASGEPVRIGLCHCRTCRRETGSIGTFYAVWPEDQVSRTGETRDWQEATEHRHFCPTCGSSLFSIANGSGEVEIQIGTLDDAPSGLTPAYELWTVRREHWLAPIAPAAQHERNKPA